MSYYSIDPWFWEEIDKRREDGANIVACAIGLPNWGKSWWCLRLCQEIHERWQLSKFDGDGIVFNAKQFWNRMSNTEEDTWTLWDEPNKGLSNRDWWKEMNKAVTSFIETFRFRRKNLVLALPNDSLVDKRVRQIFIFRAKMIRPGLAKIEQIIPDYYGSKEYYTYGRGEVELYSPSKKLVSDYNERKMEFHKQDFPEEAFEDVPETRMMEKSWQAVKRKILEDPRKYQREVGYKTNNWVYSARKIAAILEVSDNTARRAIDKIELEREASESGTS